MTRRLRLAFLLPLCLVFVGAAAPAQDLIVPGENLVVEGIPPLPRSLAERAGPYMEFRSASFQGWNPLRPEMLITTRFGDVPQLHRVAMPAGARTQLTFYGERVLGGRYRPKSADIVFVKDVGGGEWYQLYLRDDRTGKVTLLTDGKSRNTPGAFTKSGTWMAYQLDEADREEQRHLGHEPVRPEDGPDGPRGERRAPGRRSTGPRTRRRSSSERGSRSRRAASGSSTWRRGRSASSPRSRRRRSPGAPAGSRTTERPSTRRRTPAGSSAISSRSTSRRGRSRT